MTPIPTSASAPSGRSTTCSTVTAQSVRDPFGFRATSLTGQNTGSPAAAALRALGVEGALKRLKDDVILDVRDRARDAVDQLEGKGPADIF